MIKLSNLEKNFSMIKLSNLDSLDFLKVFVEQGLQINKKYLIKSQKNLNCIFGIVTIQAGLIENDNVICDFFKIVYCYNKSSRNIIRYYCVYCKFEEIMKNVEEEIREKIFFNIDIFMKI